MRNAATLDPARIARGASTGFTVLVVGGLAAPMLAAALPVTRVFWLPLVAVSAFVVAAVRAGDARVPVLHGAAAASAAYALALPLVLLNPSGRNVSQIALTAAAALLVGGVVGWIASKRKETR